MAGPVQSTPSPSSEFYGHLHEPAPLLGESAPSIIVPV